MDVAFKAKLFGGLFVMIFRDGIEWFIGQVVLSTRAFLRY